MIKFNLKDPVKADDLNRALQELYAALQPTSTFIPVTKQQAGGGGYVSQLTDVVIEVVGAGNLRINLPATGPARDLLIITQTGTASVQATGGSISGHSSLGIMSNSSLRLFFDGAAWWT